MLSVIKSIDIATREKYSLLISVDKCNHNSEEFIEKLEEYCETNVYGKVIPRERVLIRATPKKLGTYLNCQWAIGIARKEFSGEDRYFVLIEDDCLLNKYALVFVEETIANVINRKWAYRGYCLYNPVWKQDPNVCYVSPTVFPLCWGTKYEYWDKIGRMPTKREIYQWVTPTWLVQDKERLIQTVLKKETPSYYSHILACNIYNLGYLFVFPGINLAYTLLDGTGTRVLNVANSFFSRETATRPRKYFYDTLKTGRCYSNLVFGKPITYISYYQQFCKNKGEET